MLEKRCSYERVSHPWPAFYRPDSRVLILGTIPSPASRSMGFYYGHPQNVFWQILAAVLGAEEPQRSIKARKAFLAKYRIALWDVLSEAELCGASDASIRNPKPQVFRPLLTKAPAIHTIFTTGKRATGLFNALCAKEAGMQARYLPSTSPANRALQAKSLFKTQWQQVAQAVFCSAC